MKKATKKTSPKMISYSMKMTIPTGNYANIQPEIVVKGGTIEEAHDFIAPHMNRLWKEYYMISERPKNEPASSKPTIAKTVEPPPPNPKPVEEPVSVAQTVPEEVKKQDEQITPPAPASAVALHKATQAVASCLSKEALDLIAAQVEKSVKLQEEDKIELRKLITEKTKEFN